MSNSNHSNGTSGAAASHKNSKKVEEVKEVVMNKSDADIAKVLEYFDNDVGLTIDAFVNDGGKEALQKWAEQKAQKRQQQKQSNSNTEQSQATDESNKKPKNKKPPNGNAAKKFNINDMVASVINQAVSSSSSSPSSTPLAQSISDATSSFFNINRLVNSSTNSHFGAVTVLGVQTSTANDSVINNNNNNSNTSPVISSITSSPSSMSNISSSSSNKTQNGQRPSLLDLKNLSLAQQPQPQQSKPNYKNINTSYVNPNARAAMEKHQKDLQRQTALLNRIPSVFQDELNKRQQELSHTFQQLRQVLNEKQAQLETQLIAAAQAGNSLLQQRQSKAVELKYLCDSCQHLNDAELNELKADIKHFVSERQIDEEFGKLKLLQLDGLSGLIQSIQTFATITSITNQYAKQRPPASVVNANSPVNGQQAQQKPAQNGSQVDKNNNKNLANGNAKIANGAKANGLNGNSNSNNHPDLNNDDNEGEFIEVKKPQRNKNKQMQQQQQSAQQPQVNVNGTNKQLNGKPYTNGNSFSNNNNNNNNKLPKQNGDYNKIPNNRPVYQNSN